MTRVGPSLGAITCAQGLGPGSTGHAGGEPGGQQQGMGVRGQQDVLAHCVVGVASSLTTSLRGPARTGGPRD
jgi:hypothetical protein